MQVYRQSAYIFVSFLCKFKFTYLVTILCLFLFFSVDGKLHVLAACIDCPGKQRNPQPPDVIIIFNQQRPGILFIRGANPSNNQGFFHTLTPKRSGFSNPHYILQRVFIPLQYIALGMCNRCKDSALPFLVHCTTLLVVLHVLLFSNRPNLTPTD